MKFCQHLLLVSDFIQKLHSLIAHLSFIYTFCFLRINIRFDNHGSICRSFARFLITPCDFLSQWSSTLRPSSPPVFTAVILPMCYSFCYSVFILFFRVLWTVVFTFSLSVEMVSSGVVYFLHCSSISALTIILSDE